MGTEGQFLTFCEQIHPTSSLAHGNIQVQWEEYLTAPYHLQELRAIRLVLQHFSDQERIGKY